MQTNEHVTLHLGDFDRHGTTRARYNGRWIEVEHGIPGEVVQAEIVGGKRPWGRIVEVLEPAPDRVEPPCPYFRDWACGGCQWQQIAYEGQVERKRRAVDATMQRAGHDLAVEAVHLADPWRYRSTAGIALGKRAGFRRHGSLAIVPLRDCPISHPLIGRLCAELNDAIEAGSIPDYRGRVRVDVRVVEGSNRLQTCIRPTEGEHLPAPDMLRPLEITLSSLADVASVAVLAGPEVSAVTGALYAPTEVGGKPVWLSAVSFFQTNLLLLPDLISRVRTEAEPLRGKRIADVYGGVGLFGLFLAEGAREVVVIEADPMAVEAGRRTADDWELSNIAFTAASAEEALAPAGRFDVVIVDPPRAGLDASVIEALVAEPPELLLYVSCLPSSLARDLGPLLEGDYSVEHLELFDFYPQTYHVELLAALRRDKQGTALAREDHRRP
jgi:23S rRNA (uracil1939-C5)-methyltransferase